MGLVDQHMALLSQAKALVPKDTLIDGRTELDWLNFLTELANCFGHQFL